jgi:NIPSNAP protein/serine protease-like protein with rhomboid domain
MTQPAVRMAAIVVLSFLAGAFAVATVTRTQGGRAAADRVFELRVYRTLPGRLQALESNFRDHNVDYMKKHGIESVGYWTPQDSPASENTLILIVAHDSREAAEQHWNEFRSDPEWKKLAQASLASGEIVEKIDSTFLTPTDFSPMK